jgi:transposase
MLNINPSTKVFICSEPIDMRYSFDALSGLVSKHFGLNPLCGHIFVFFSRQGDRMKLLSWDLDGFALYYKRLERGTYSWIKDLNLNEGGEIQASDFAMIVTGINPCTTMPKNKKRNAVAPRVAPLQLV